MTVDDKLVRHCNWVRFLRATDFRQRANIETRRVRGRIVFEVTRDVEVNEELLCYFPATHPDPEPTKRTARKPKTVRILIQI